MTWVQVFHKLLYLYYSLCIGHILHVSYGGYYISLKPLIGAHMLVIWTHFEFKAQRIITYDFLPQLGHSVWRLKIHWCYI